MAGSTISGTIYHGISLDSPGYVSPLTITETGAMLQSSSQPGFPSFGIGGPSTLSDAAVFNYGTIAAAYGESAPGIELLGSDGTVSNTGYIGGGLEGGVILYAGGEVTNAGTILGGSGEVKAGQGLALLDSAGLSNSGTIVGGKASIGTGAFGVNLGFSGSVGNTGTIIGGGGQYAGAAIAATAAYVTNHGLIIGGSGVASGGPGVEQISGGVLANYGSIIGGAGVRGGAGITDQGIDTNFGFISGGVATPSAVAGTSGVGLSLTGGGTFTNFGSLTGGAGTYDAATESAGQGGAGARLDYGTTLINNGVISGGNGASNGFVVKPGTTLTPDGTGGLGVNVAADSNTATDYAGYSAGTLNFFNAGPSLQDGTGGAGVYVGAGGVLINTGTISGGNTGTYTGAVTILGGPGVNINGGTVVTSGRIAAGAASQPSGLADYVAVAFNSAGTLVVDPGAVFAGEVEANPSFADTLELAGSSGTTLQGIGGQISGFSEISFATGATWAIAGIGAQFDASHETIAGLAPGDRIVLEQFTAESFSYVSGAGIEVSDGTTPLTLDVAGSFTSDSFEISINPGSTTIAVAPCFTPATRILTTRGEVAVEALVVGDAIINHAGEDKEIVWIGRRDLDIGRHPKPETVRPIIIEAEALAEGVPARRLVLSPDHALFIDGVLVQAKDLVNGGSIRPDMQARQTRYYHVELAEHDVLFAEGAAVESYLDTGHRGVFDDADAPLLLHPELMQLRREAEGCAPLCLGGPKLAAIRRDLARRQHNQGAEAAARLAS